MFFTFAAINWRQKKLDLKDGQEYKTSVAKQNNCQNGQWIKEIIAPCKHWSVIVGGHIKVKEYNVDSLSYSWANITQWSSIMFSVKVVDFNAVEPLVKANGLIKLALVS